MEVIHPAERKKRKKGNLEHNLLFSPVFRIAGLESKNTCISVSRARLFSWSLNKLVGTNTPNY